ncbi:helicase HerA domain-containing protein [Caldivirga sp.]|uniref:helicase HerA domain-containing protein n=1 Tax=Caldivirga sp. TaxID=2080243 RepID=UPI003D0C1D37
MDRRLALVFMVSLIASVAYPPLSPLLWVVSLLTRDWFHWLSLLIYGGRVAPRSEVRGGRLITNGESYLFYEAEPLIDLSTSHEKALVALSNMLNRLSGEVGFYRLNSKLYIRVPEDSRDELVLRQFFILRQVKPNQVVGLITRFNPINLAWFSLVGLLIKWPLSLPTIVIITVAVILHSRHFSLNLNQHPGIGVASSGVAFTRLDSGDRLAIAMGNAGRDFILILKPNPGFRAIATEEYNRYRELAVTRVRGRFEQEAEQWRIVLDRLNNGELGFRALIIGDVKLPASRVGRALNHLSEPNITLLTNDAQYIPVFQGQALESGLSRAIVEVGVDRFSNPITLDLDALGNAHGVVIGPSGRGKTKTTMSLIMRMPQLNYLILDPEGEYCRVFKDWRCVNADEAYIDYLAPFNESPYVKANYIYDSFKHSFNAEDEAILSLYEGEYPGLINALDWLTANSRYSRYWRMIRGMAPGSIISLEGMLNGRVIINYSRLRQEDRLISLMMQALVGEVFNAYLNRRSEGELVRQVIIADEAYLILGSRAVWSLIRAGRKRGLSLWFITQSIQDAPPGMIQNLGFSIILAGPDAYINEVRQHFGLSQADYDWLRLDIPPRLLGGEWAMGILYAPPTPRHAYIRLEPSALG